MKKLYITVALCFLISVILFIASFIYLDKSKRATYYYTINMGGSDTGTVRIDRFETEDKIIYKSITDRPFERDFTETKTKMEFDRKYNFLEYVKERRGSGAPELLFLENRKNAVSFLAKFQSCFSFLEKIPVRNDTYVFEEGAPMTYLPLVENYNFRKGRAQGFGGLLVFSPTLPPMKKLITLTSIKDEYLRIDARNIKTENLLMKIRNYPQGTIWVAKSDKSLIRLEIPELKIKVTRTFKPKNIVPKELEFIEAGYSSREIAFTNKKVKLAGTVTIPEGNGPFPAVLLVPPPGPGDREYYGFFTSIAGYLSKNGFYVLRFDKRGVGQSAGDASSHTFNDELEDLNAALDYLTQAKEIDPGKIAVISHSGGAFYALKLASGGSIVKAVIMMAPSLYLDCNGHNDPENLKNMASRYMWSEDYLKIAANCLLETAEKAKNARHGWIFLLRKICFVKNLREEMALQPLEAVKNVKVPVMILQGKDDDDQARTDTASIINKALEEAGNQNNLVRYYGYLGHFLGKKVSDGVHKVYYEADKEVMNSIKDWLDFTLSLRYTT